ncbi:sulfate transporter N-terminal domain with GLY motif-domain-containing protein [Entophlyctis helioformis]|nr:sulfate transporter N-terminal domain with GLY motif-domain-containing protein [Entophlyctis helioformis]
MSFIPSSSPSSPFNSSGETANNKKKQGWRKLAPPKKAFSMLPIVGWLPCYSPRFLANDIIAGFTLATLLIPQAMGYAVMANLPPVVGLYSASIPPLLYFLFGISPYGSMGPMAVTSLMVGDSVLSVAKSFARARLGPQSANATSAPLDVPAYIQYPDVTRIAALQSLLIGVVLFLLLVTQAYKLLNKLFTNALIAGFTTAAAFAIMTSQVKSILGLRITMPSGLGTSFMSWIVILANIAKVNWVALALSTVAIAALLLIPKAEVAMRLQWRKWRMSRRDSKAAADAESATSGTKTAGTDNTDQDDTLARDSVDVHTLDGRIRIEDIEAFHSKSIHSVFPSVLFVVAVLTAISALLSLPSKTGISVIGTIQSGLPGFTLPWHFLDLQSANATRAAMYNYPPPPSSGEIFSLVLALIPSSISIALVSYVTSLSLLQTFPADTIVSDESESMVEYSRRESGASTATNSSDATLLSSKSTSSSKTLPVHDDAFNERQELFALAMSTLISSFFSCFGGGNALARSAVLAKQTETRSPFASLFAVVLVLLIVSFVTKPFELVPTPVLSAVIIAAILSLFCDITEGWRLFVKARVETAESRSTVPCEPEAADQDDNGSDDHSEHVCAQETLRIDTSLDSPSVASHSSMPVSPVSPKIAKALAYDADTSGQQVTVGQQPNEKQHPFLSSIALGLFNVALIWEDFIVWTFTLLVTAFVDAAVGIITGIAVVAVFKAVAFAVHFRMPKQKDPAAIVVVEVKQ